MPKSTGYILDTPLQSWSLASEKCIHSSLVSDIERSMTNHSSYVIVENVLGVQKSEAFKITLNRLEGYGYTTTVLYFSDKTIIVGQK